MLIKLTNASPEFKGTDLLLNTDSIVSVSASTITRQTEDGDSTPETVTFLFCPPHGTWEVTETIEEVLALFNTKKGCCK